MKRSLKGKRILITAGPTWVPIDKVRVITNIFSGNLGIVIAKEAARQGAQVTLLIGPGRLELPQQSAKLKVVPFRYFDGLLALVDGLLNKEKYEVLIMSAAVADFS